MMPNNEIIKDSWNVLIVDDNKDIHLITRNAFWGEIVCERPLNFLFAYTKEEAISTLKEKHKDIALILLDMALGDSGDEGYDVIKFIFNMLENGKIQIILRTGYYNRGVVKEIAIHYPQVYILEKGETEADQLIRIVTGKITNYNSLINEN